MCSDSRTNLAPNKHALSVVRFPSFVVRPSRRRRRLVFVSQHNANPTAHLQPLVAVVGWIPRSLSLLSRDSYLVLIRAGGTQVSTYFRCRSNALSLATQHTHFIHRIFRKLLSSRRASVLRIHRSISSIHLLRSIYTYLPTDIVPQISNPISQRNSYQQTSISILICWNRLV